MNKISNEDFNKAYNNLDNAKIMASAIKTSGTTRILSKDELESCKMMGLWRTLQIWSKKDFPNVKFTTFLFKHVRWQCYSQAHNATKYQKRDQELVDSSDFAREKSDKNSFSLEDRLYIDGILEKLPDNILKIIEQRFYKQMTFKEIGKSQGCSHEAARTHLKKAIKEIKKLYM